MVQTDEEKCPTFGGRRSPLTLRRCAEAPLGRKNKMNEPKKTKQQLKRSARNSLLWALLIAVFPIFYVIDYRKWGYIYSGKPRIIKTTGIDALIIMYGTLAVAIIAVLFAGYNVTRCIIKIRRGEYSVEDEAPEFVICKNCKTPQYSKDLIKGRCAKCSGIVVNLEGYYKHHPKKHQEEKAR